MRDRVAVLLVPGALLVGVGLGHGAAAWLAAFGAAAGVILMGFALLVHGAGLKEASP